LKAKDWLESKSKEVENINISKSLEKKNNFTIKTGFRREIQFLKVNKFSNYKVIIKF
jgi:hypothetical protein